MRERNECVRSSPGNTYAPKSSRPNATKQPSDNFYTGMRQRTVEEEVAAVTKRLLWLPPDLAMDTLRAAYKHQQARARKALLAKHGLDGW